MCVLRLDSKVVEAKMDSSGMCYQLYDGQMKCPSSDYNCFLRKCNLTEQVKKKKNPGTIIIVYYESATVFYIGN